jgi:NAD(P)-dependent dehydrogenase (short-subunit alcohol dehydrogenase family)
MSAGRGPTPRAASLVTGAGSGVGRAVAVVLAREVGPVVLVGRRRERLDETAGLISAAKAGGPAHVRPADVSDPESVRGLFEDLEKQDLTPAILVNCAGVNGRHCSIEESDPDGWINTIRINLIGPYLMTRSALPHMKSTGWGRIVNVSSAASLGIGTINTEYNLSKVALNHFTRQTAKALAGTEVAATAIHPGEVKSEMWEHIRDDASARGESGAGARKWARMVEETGGDPPEKAAELVLRIVRSPAAEVNDRFLWIEDGIQAPREVWSSE